MFDPKTDFELMIFIALVMIGFLVFLAGLVIIFIKLFVRELPEEQSKKIKEVLNEGNKENTKTGHGEFKSGDESSD